MPKVTWLSTERPVKHGTPGTGPRAASRESHPSTFQHSDATPPPSLEAPGGKTQVTALPWHQVGPLASPPASSGPGKGSPDSAARQAEGSCGGEMERGQQH